MKYIKGVDISTLLEIEENGGCYFDFEGKKTEMFEFLKSCNINAVRLRLWNNPYDDKQNPYGAGTNDLERTIILGKRAASAGMDILLDFHYSDFWADPGKQFVPKAWRGHGIDELEKDVYLYTKEVMLALKKEGIVPFMVQVGNELSNGLLWPIGKVPEYDNIHRLVAAGIKAVREVSPESRIMLHLDNGGNNELYRRWFDEYIRRGDDFDIIGLSYYPFWHGNFEALKANMNDIALRYSKELIIAEVSMGFSMEDYSRYEFPDGKGSGKGYATRRELVEKIEYPMTEEGQSDFLKRLFDVIFQVPENRGRGFFYWEPGWIPVPGVGWATQASLEYINDPGPCGNEWANQALFDYEGHALSGFKVIRDAEAGIIG